LEWMYRHGAADFEAMSSLPRELRAGLAQRAVVLAGAVRKESVAPDGTRKLLIAYGSQAVETVWIPTQRRHTACISSQVGCPVGCRFCASGLDGVERNLSAGEIVEQALRVCRLIESAEPATAEKPHGRNRAGSAVNVDGRPLRLSNIVLMGMGEPLANYANVIRAVRILNAPWGLGIGARKLTLSTVGLPAQMRRLADEDLQINLALSLHATDDTLRHELIPWGKGVPIRELMDACRYYFEKTGREVTFEYVLLDGVNDELRQADELARLARGVRANINLLRYNPVPGVPFRRPSAEAAFAFQSRIREHGANVHIRTSRGIEADAACGQLRRAATAASSEPGA
jgi:23S rRNA (adenine2503-C2)-methyltransferase